MGRGMLDARWLTNPPAVADTPTNQPYGRKISAWRSMRFLSERHRQPEIMDEPDMAGERHAQALRGLERINAWSGSARSLWPPLADLAGSGPIRALDVATGAGDVPIRLWQKARRHGIALEIAGCDRSASALEYARQRALAAKADVHFFQWDALQAGVPSGYDAVMSSL